jgi:hypothetical protein
MVGIHRRRTVRLLATTLAGGMPGCVGQQTKTNPPYLGRMYIIHVIPKASSDRASARSNASCVWALEGKPSGAF